MKNPFEDAETVRAFVKEGKDRAAQEQAQTLHKKIQVAKEAGQLSLTVYEDIVDSVVHQLTDKNYKVKRNPGDQRDQRDTGSYTISWA